MQTQLNTIDAVLSYHIDNTFKTIRNLTLTVKYRGENKPEAKLRIDAIRVQGRDLAELPIIEDASYEVDLTDSLPDAYFWYEHDNPNSLAIGSFGSWREFIHRFDGLLARVNNFAKSARLQVQLVEE